MIEETWHIESLAFHGLPDPVIVLDRAKTRVVSVNRKAEELGFSPGLVAQSFVLEASSDRLGEQAYLAIILHSEPYRRWQARISEIAEGGFWLLVIQTEPSGWRQVSPTNLELLVDLSRAVGRGFKNSLQALMLANEQTGSLLHGVPHLVTSVRGSMEAGELLVGGVQHALSSLAGAQESKRAFGVAAFLQRVEPVLRNLIAQPLKLIVGSGLEQAQVWASEASLLQLLAALVLLARDATDALDAHTVVLQLSASESALELSVSLEGGARPSAGVDSLLRSTASVETRISWLQNAIRQAGGSPVEAVVGSSALYAFRLPRMPSIQKRQPAAPAKTSQTAVYLSSQDRGVRAMFRVAAERAGSSLESGLGAPVSLFGRQRRHIAWIVDLDTADFDAIGSVLRAVVEQGNASLPIPLILVSRVRSAGVAEPRDLVVALCERGAAFLRKPITVSRATEAIEGLALRDADSPWYRPHLPS